MTASTDPPQDLSTWDCYAGDVAFAVTAHSAWLSAQRAYLSGFLTAPPGELDLGAFSLRVHTDDTAFQQIVSTLARSPGASHVEPVPGLVMRESVHPTGHRCYVITIDGVERQPGAYAVAAQGRHIDLLTHSGTLRPHRYPIRLIREAMLRTYEDTGGVIFHAAGVDVSGCGVMVCGPRGSGKTTITAALLRCPGAALLSNDRLIAHQRDHLVAVPLPVPTGRGTIEAFPELQRTGAVEPGRMPAEFGSTVKHAFTARQFALAFGAGLVSASVLRLVVVPQLTDTRQPARVRHLGAAQAGQIIAENCFTPRDEFWVRPWLVPRQKADDLLRHQAKTAIGHITTAVPCVEVSFGVRNPLTDLVHTLDKIVGDTW
ncbi:MAG: hypothetical protein ACRDSR_12310 [Pseudonocardiaceae bacterium]